MCDPSLMREARELALKAKSPNTVKRYKACWARFTTWIKRNSAGSFPASPMDVGLFLTGISRQAASMSTVYAYFYAIRWGNAINGQCDPTEDPFPKSILEGCKRSISGVSKTKTPITPMIVESICARYANSSNSLRECRFACMAAFAFAGFLRIGELLSLKKNQVRISDGCLILFLPKSKTDVYGQGTEVVLSDVDSPACPRTVYASYQTFLENCEEDAFIFRPIASKKARKFRSGNRAMPYTKAREELRFFLRLLGHKPNEFTWHSFRHGGATTAANNDVPSRLLKAHGRWKSDRGCEIYIKNSLKNKKCVSASLFSV